MASAITIDGQLTDWTLLDRLDFGVTGATGFKIYGRVGDGAYHFAIDSGSVPIGANSTMWLNTDQNATTGYKIFGLHLGADYKIEFESDPTLGVRPTLYALAPDGTPTLVEGGVSFAFSPTGTAVELAIDKVKIGDTAAINTLIDINETYYLPADYSQGQFTLDDELPPVRTDPTLRVAIIFSESSAKQYFSETAYSQLIMAAQSQAAAAGIPFDILTESDLTNLSTVVNYDALIFPSFGFVEKDKLTVIEDVLTAAVFQYGISLVAAGNFMTNDETGAAFPGDSYARMKSLLGVERIGGANVAEVTVTGSGEAGAGIIGYGEGEFIRTYSQIGASLVGTAYFDGVTGGKTQALATQSASDGTHNAVLATETGSNNVFFATEGMLADSNMLQHAIGWVARPLESPELKLQMGRQASLFAARNDMDQSQEARNVSDGIYTKLLSIIEKWKTDFNFVGSYYVNIGNDAGNGQTTDWTKSKPVYDQLLVMGNEIGTHSYTHPEDTNLLTPEQIQFEFEQSKLVLEQKLGITIKGAAVPGAPESLTTSQLIGQYFSYTTGGYTGVGAGYPGAFGYITPDSGSVYLAPNMKFDFSMVEAAPEYGGGLTPEQAKQEWIREFEELSLKSDMPVFVWPWHDYGPTQWVINQGQPSAYTEEMYTEFLRYAYEKDTEFVTMQDLAQRIKAFGQAKFSYNFNSASNTIMATVTANQIGTFALDVEKGQTIASVSGWYAYDNDSIFLDVDGGTYNIKLGTAPEDVTHITGLPARAQLLSVTGDGTNLSFSIYGEGKISIDLTDPKGRLLTVAGADITTRNGDKLELKVSGNGEHTVSIQLKPPAVNIALVQDTGISINDGITNNSALKLTGVIPGAKVEYSLDNSTWTTSFTPVEGSNTVHVRQTDTAGTASAVTTFSFVLDRVGPNASVELPPLSATGTSTVTITFSEPPTSFDPETDLEVIGGTLTELMPDVTGTIYTGTFKAFASHDGAALVALKAGSYTDTAGNAGAASSASQGIDNKAPTAVALVNQVGQTAESGSPVKVADIATTDDGLGTNLLTLVGADAGAYEIRGSELWFKGGADYEAKQSYAVQVKASDSAGQGEVTSVEFRLAITNVNDNAPVITTANVHAVAENQMLVAALAATDADIGSTPATFSLSGGADVDLFRIDGGNLVFKTAPDYESGKTSYQVEVSASDGLYTTKKVITVNLTDVAEGQNQAPTAVALVNPVGQTAENGSAVKVADIVTTDDGLGANNLSLVGSDAGAYEIRGSELWFKGGADYEVKQSYAVQVKAADSAGQGEVTSPEFRLAVTDVKEDRVAFNFKLTEATFSFAASEVAINGPGGQHFVLSGFKHFQFTDGTVNEDDGNTSVSDLFYYAQNEDVWNAGVDADDHYATFGWQEGRNPNAFFSTNGYLSANQDVDAANINPLEHYHQNGWKEGRDASVSFDTTLYLLNNADVRNAGVDPLEHYLAYGQFEGRQTYTAVGLKVQGTFDAEYYLLANPDVGLADVDAAFHFTTYGWKEGRDPNAFFDTSAYLQAYDDVAAAGVNPLEHYNAFGWKEGRDPSGAFDTSAYLATYTDVAAANVNPLEHYLKFGVYEGRSGFEDGLIA